MYKHPDTGHICYTLKGCCTALVKYNILCSESEVERINAKMVEVGYKPWTQPLQANPTPEELLAQAQASMWESIKSHRDYLEGAGVYVASLDKWFHTDDKSRIKYLGLESKGASVPIIPWKTMDGTFIMTTESVVDSILNAVFLADITNFANAEHHRQAMLLSPTPLEYDFSSGWIIGYTAGGI